MTIHQGRFVVVSAGLSGPRGCTRFRSSHRARLLVGAAERSGLATLAGMTGTFDESTLFLPSRPRWPQDRESRLLECDLQIYFEPITSERSTFMATI